MFLIKIKADANDIDVPSIRALTGAAVFVTVASRNEHNFVVSITVAIALLIIGIFLQWLLVKKRMDSLLLVLVVSILTVIAKHEVFTALILLTIAFVIRFSYIQPAVEIAEKYVRIKKTFHNKTHDWSSFNNIILKDNLLTLDFKNNKVLQLELDKQAPLDEQQFNAYCAQKITT